MDCNSIRKYLGVIRRACDLIEQQLDSQTTEAFDQILSQSEIPSKPKVNPNEAVKLTTVTPPDNSHIEARKKHVKDLMAIDCWPQAVPSYSVGPVTESDQINRARAVLDFTIGNSIEGMRFLDYGCGDGYIASEASLRGCAEVVGFDLTPSECWGKFQGVQYTTKAQDLKKHHYDLVFLYDVLDHAHDPEALVSHIKELVKPTGFVYVRFHPWTSKHGSHLAKIGLNKSFIHLFLTYEELTELGYQPIFTRMEKSPLEAYHYWFRDFEIQHKRIEKAKEINPFFHVDAFKELLSTEQGIALDKIDDFLDLMRVDFVDFVFKVPKQ